MSSIYTGHKVAILYQALPPPVIGGQRKKPRVGGYSDSGSDIGFVLRKAGIEVITPVQSPNPHDVMEWVFPDTEEGIIAAISSGADTLWANTVLFKSHPIENVLDKLKIVGQLPASLDNFDDKFLANQFFMQQGLPVAVSFLAARKGARADYFLDENDHLDSDMILAERGLEFPVIVKPVRGRGSQGVTFVDSAEAMDKTIVDLLDSGLFGESVIVEQYLDGEEITVSVMPPKSLTLDGRIAKEHWSLSPVIREGHKNGVVPFNGDVLVTMNSRAMNKTERETPAVRAICRACEAAALSAQARGLVRIDCRLDSNGVYRMFDFNMKPSMTGSGRPGRDKDDSLTAMAASAHGWTFLDLLQALLASAWTGI